MFQVVVNSSLLEGIFQLLLQRCCCAPSQEAIAESYHSRLFLSILPPPFFWKGGGEGADTATPQDPVRNRLSEPLLDRLQAHIWD